MSEPVYHQTTVPAGQDEKKTTGLCGSDLSKPILALKVAQTLFSLIAFICEEIIEHCESCAGLYFFEFMSCSAFLLSLLVIIVYLTPLRNKVNIESFKKMDFYISVAVGVLFLIASIVFVATKDPNSIGDVAVAFGFLASLCFLGEAGLKFRQDRSLLKKKSPGNAANGPENAPLNQPPSTATANA
ncbi:CKLF-like MARVEL transmembrane domain-containing 6 [Pelobates cultripes]|uniref:CKLF-like MARVEL transmembrane domain-containing 6 n=1 Tax=Pelobates cultripes TaxID=61616 RepID=A0AAD1W384_PELCU|nr:CKLF-like MARVEL transmembrane domain-containing 6 [Pelobates cultripes]